MKGPPPEWREGLFNKIIRYRQVASNPWRLGLVIPDRDAEDSCLNCCIRVCDFLDFGDLCRSRGLRFAYPRDDGGIDWMDGCEIEVTTIPVEAYTQEPKP